MPLDGDITDHVLGPLPPAWLRWAIIAAAAIVVLGAGWIFWHFGR
jgi:hypothetical protein